MARQGAAAKGGTKWIAVAWQLTVFLGRVALVLLTFATLTLDIVFGAIVLKLVLHGASGWMCWAISLSTAAARIIMWDMLLTGKRQTITAWVILSLLVFINTLCDLSLLPHFLYGQSPENIFPIDPGTMYYPLALIVAAIASLDCFLTTWLVQYLEHSS